MADVSEEVKKYFEEAVEQRAELDLFFMLDRCQFSQILAPIVRVRNGLFVVLAKIKSLDESPVIWGAEVNVYFSLKYVETVHCHFRTRLVRIYNGPLDSMYLVFPLPRYLDHAQRRFSLRIGLKQEDSAPFGIWHGEMIGGDYEELPKLAWQPLADEYCELAELSASGMRLDMPEKSHIGTRLNINDLVLLKGDFGSGSKSEELFLLGRIVRKMPRLDVEGMMSAGCHFYSWRKIGGKTWFRIDPQEGLAPVAQWLARNYRTMMP